MLLRSLFSRSGIGESSLKSRTFKAAPVIQNYTNIQNEIFEEERSKQFNKIGRIEKIEVKYRGGPQAYKLFMNKLISTPHNVTQHISEWIMKRSALALINGDHMWDMHRPLEKNCEIEFLSFTDPEPYHVNKAFWRTCSFLLGAIIKEAFSDKIDVLLHSFPSPQIASGSFTHDAYLSLDNWQPSVDELRLLSAQIVKYAQKELLIERLEVNEKIALEIFKENKYKLKQIPNISANFNGRLVLYRVGQHIDISKGPMIGNTRFIGRCSIAAVHQIEKDGERLYRFQGVALPQGIMMNQFAYKIIEDRASKLNDVPSNFIERNIEEMRS